MRTVENTQVTGKKVKYDDLLKEPELLGALDDVDKRYPKSKRIKTSHTQSERFILNPKATAQQYFTLYANRLESLKGVVHKRVMEEWVVGKDKDLIVHEKILSIREGETCVVIGAIIKDMPLRPSVLAEFAKERAILNLAPRDSYLSDKDTVFLEDDTGRTKLQGVAFQTKDFVTGMIVAVRGRGVTGGEFEVHEILEPGFAPQPPLPVCSVSKGRYVALVSGLNFGAEGNPVFYELLSEFLTGNLGGKNEHNFQAGISHLIIAGNSIVTPHEEKLSDLTQRFSKKDKVAIAQPVRHFDEFLQKIATEISAEILPGEKDPSNFSMPQQPLSTCLFRKSGKFPTIKRVSNPYQCTIEGVSFLGHSGQPIENIARYMEVTDTMKLIEKMFRWRNIAPSCPDNLSTFPASVDPFILESSPQVFFVGNQKKFESEVLIGENNQKIRVVLLPSFSESHSIVLLDLDTLEVTPLNFSTWDSS